MKRFIRGTYGTFTAATVSTVFLRNVLSNRLHCVSGIDGHD